MTLTAPDPRTVQITWPMPYGYRDYLNALSLLLPLPFHIYATGKFAGVFNPLTGAYNSTLAQQLVSSSSFNTTIPVDNGPFTVQSYPSLSVPVVLARNPRFFSNFFHQPALQQVTFRNAYLDLPNADLRQAEDDLIALYRRGDLTLAEGLEPLNLNEMGDIPAHQVITSPVDSFIEYGFNERSVAPNAQANEGISMFADKSVRQAFIEAFDRCTAVHSLLGIECNNPNIHSDELTAPPAPDYDPTFKLPAYSPADAAALLDRAGYPVVDGIRRGRDGKTPLHLQMAVSFGATPSLGLATSLQQDLLQNLQIGMAITTYGPELFHSYSQGGVAARGAFDLLMEGGSGFGPDPVGTFTGFDRSDIPSAQNPNGGNLFGIVDAHLGQQDRLGSVTQDVDQRIGIYHDLQRYFADQFYIEPLYIGADVTLTQPTLCNYKKWPLEMDSTWNMADWYVAQTCP
jgi:ABC-type transport system substrate-binding protein